MIPPVLTYRDSDGETAGQLGEEKDGSGRKKAGRKEED